MADISKLLRLVNGVQSQIDLSSNSLVVLSVKVGGGVNTELTKAILDNLVSLQNGSDIANTLHHHDGRYFTETELLSTTVGSSGATKIGVSGIPTNYSAATNTVQDHLAGIDTALANAAAVEFSDSTFRIKDNLDATKKIAFEASAITTATVRTITMPDANVNLADANNAILKDGTRAFTADQPMGGFKLTGLAAGSAAGHSVRYEQAILVSGANAFAADQSFGGFKATNLADPTAAQEAATKAYVDSLINGRKWKQNARVASTANVALSASALTAGLTVDGIALASGDRVLLKDQTAGAENGIYDYSQSGVSPNISYTLTRSADADTAAELQSAAIWVAEGTSNADKQFAQTADNITLGTTALTWVISSANHFSGHDMVALSGGSISVDLAAVSGLESSNPGNAAGQLRVKLQATNPSLQITGSNELAAKLDAAGAIASGAAGLAVQVDNSSIEIFTNALRVKAAGVQASHLNSNVADQTTLTGGAGAALAVQYSPKIQVTRVAGEAFAANTTFAVRFALTGETAGRAYKADKDASTSSKYNVVGLALAGGGAAIGGNISVVTEGSVTLGSLDTAFLAADVGKAVYLTAAGAFSVTAPSATNEAVFVIGYVEDTNKIFVTGKHLRGIN